MVWGTVSRSLDITRSRAVKRSTPAQSPSVTTPTGRSPSTTITALWARLVMRFMASPTVSVGAMVMGVSCTTWRRFTQSTTSATTSSGMSWGMTAMPPRRATVSAMRRPATAVMLATTMGMVVPVPSTVVRSTSRREVTSDRTGTMNTSSNVRSGSGSRSWRKRTRRAG